MKKVQHHFTNCVKNISISAIKRHLVPPPSPFLYTTHIRPISAEVKKYLLTRGAKLFASMWTSYSHEDVSTDYSYDASCRLPPSWGSSCKDTIPQWTFNSSLGKCLPYWFSGCGATQNLFSNERKCRIHCGKNLKGNCENILNRFP